MKISRRQFLITTFVGLVGLLFGRFFNLFRGKDSGKRAMFWKKGERLAG